MNVEQLKSSLNKAVTENMRVISYAYDRWQDEKEYEDWSEYDTYIRKNVKIPEGFTLAKVNKRPFGITLNCDNFTARIKCTSRGISWDATKTS